MLQADLAYEASAILSEQRKALLHLFQGDVDLLRDQARLNS